MKTKKFNEYSYRELYERATSPNAEQIDIDTLGEWLMQYDVDEWNGCFFTLENGDTIIPIYSDEDENGDIEVIHWEFGRV